MRISDETQTKIQSRIAEIEKQTTCELICLITQKSARYVFCPLFIAALLSLFLPVLEIAWDFFGYSEIALTFQHQAIAFVLLSSLLAFTPFNRLLTPKWVMRQNCDRYCMEQFFAHKLNETTGRNAILFFVSWDEKFVRVIADKAIHDKVDQKIWDEIVKDFIAKAKSKSIEDGFIGSIEKAATILIENFPADALKNDELPNHLIVLSGPEYVA